MIRENSITTKDYNNNVTVLSRDITRNDTQSVSKCMFCMEVYFVGNNIIALYIEDLASHIYTLLVSLVAIVT